jgi:hypothetical protein
MSCRKTGDWEKRLWNTDPVIQAGPVPVPESLSAVTEEANPRRAVPAAGGSVGIHPRAVPLGTAGKALIHEE